jgi:hypothetical protein
MREKGLRLSIRERPRSIARADVGFGTVAFIIAEDVFYAFLISFGAVGFSVTVAMLIQLLR